MKKVLMSVFAIAVLAGCASNYDYYKGGVKYTQDGPDCVYSADEQGDRFSNTIVTMEGARTVVYRNTLCAGLYEKDTATQELNRRRSVIAPAAVEDAASVAPVAVAAPVAPVAPVVEPTEVKIVPACPMRAMPQAAVLKRRYIIVPAM